MCFFKIKPCPHDCQNISVCKQTPKILAILIFTNFDFKIHLLSYYKLLTIMLTLGQASCLVLGYLPNVSEERKKAKQHLQKSGLIAAYLRGQDPFRPMAIGMNVIERDPYTYISYPESPRILTEDIFHSEPHNNVNDDNDDHGNNNDSGNKDSSDDENDNSNIGEASYLTKAGHKRHHSGEIVPFCKNRLLHMISTIASHEDPHNDDCYVQQFATTESQFAMIRAIFP